MKRLLQVFEWFLYAFGLAGHAAMITLAVVIPPGWPIITALLLLAPLAVGLLGKIAPLFPGTASIPISRPGMASAQRQHRCNRTARHPLRLQR